MYIPKFWSLIALLYPGICLAQTSTLSGAGVLTLDCVAVIDGDPVSRADGSLLAYSGSFTSTYVRYELRELQEVDAATPENCSGRYDLQSRILTDIVRSRDAAFRITLEQRDGTTFYIRRFDFTGPATTSIWRVSNGSSEILLAGSIHLVTNNGLNSIPLGFSYAYAEAATLVVDQDNVSAAFAPNPQEYLDTARRTDSRPLTDGLTPATRNILNVVLDDKGLQLYFVADWNARFVSDLLYHLSLFEAGFTSPGPAVLFGQRSLVQDKPVWYLESMAGKYSLIDERYGDIDEDVLLNARFEQIFSGALTASHAADLVAWQIGNEDHDYSADYIPDLEGDEAFFRQQLVAQNQRWLLRILPWFDQPGLELVIVSAVNLTGPDGLLQLFREQGYSVSPYQ